MKVISNTVNNLFRPASAEVKNMNQSRIRAATYADLPRLVEIDLACFDDVYGDQPPAPEEVQAMLSDRLEAAGELMLVGEVNGQIEGFMTGQLTDKEPEDFISWEDTTDNGHLSSTYDSKGRFLYIVNMTVTPEGSDAHIGDMLIAHMYGCFIEHRRDSAQLLSRIPQFSRWLVEQAVDYDTLEPEQQDSLAQEYISATKLVKGKEVLYDGMLRRYGYAGAKPVKVIRDGFKDPVSKDYGVLCVVNNPLPEKVRHNRLAALWAGKVIKTVSQRPSIVKRIF